MGDFHQFPRGENQFVIIFITSNEESWCHLRTQSLPTNQ
jgi:hypothetical protein